MRLDLALVERGMAGSRAKAKSLIESGAVLIDGRVVQKAAENVEASNELTLNEEIRTCPYVSRGGLKLEGALKAFRVAPEGLICLDAGASTGGFTDCLLQEGAGKVFAVDGGHDQLAEKIKNNPKVCAMDSVNVRYLSRDTLGTAVDLIVADLSFISLTKVLSVFKDLLKEDGALIALIKPQFEAGREALNKQGIVRDPRDHKRVLKTVCEEALSLGYTVKGLTKSSIEGGDGNKEYLIYCRNYVQQDLSFNTQDSIQKLVSEAFR